MSLIDIVKFDKDGLVPAVIQDVETRQVLMVAYMNRGALEKTLTTGKTHFWSRSRQKYWMKGEESGHVQFVKEVYVDCDADCLLLVVEQKVAACHTGFRSCFYRIWNGTTLVESGQKVFDADAVYGK